MAININDYSKFVDTTTSDESKHSIAFIGRVHSLRRKPRHQPSKVDDYIGMMAESGEHRNYEEDFIPRQRVQ